MLKYMLVVGATFMAAGSLSINSSKAEELKIGQLGVMSGPSASWGLVSRYSAEALANIINEDGGWPIGDNKYTIKIVSVDDKLDQRTAIAGIERLAFQEKIKYVIGPNVDDPSIAIAPIVLKAGLFNISYGFSPSIFTAPNNNTALGMLPTYQTAPIMYRYLRDNRGVKTISFLGWNSLAGVMNRDSGVAAAKQVGLEILSDDNLYEPGTTDFFPILGGIVKEKPDLLDLGVSPSDVPLIVRAARDLGYRGIIATSVALDAKVLQEVAGDQADGFIALGGADTPEMSTPYMDRFKAAYAAVAGEWNDEAATKVYALQMLLLTMQAAGPESIEDVEVFKKAIDHVSAKNPFVKDDAVPLKWGGEKLFGQKRQIAVPLVINEYRGGKFVPLIMTSVE